MSTPVSIELNKIYNENCLNTMSRMPDNFIDLVVTSPPYDNLRDYNGYSFDFKSIANELFRVIKLGGVVVWVVNDATVNGSESGTSFKQALYFKEIGFNLHDTMIYAANKVPLTHNRYEQMFEYMFVLSKGKPKTFNGLKVKTEFSGTIKKMSYETGSTSEKKSSYRSGMDRQYTVNPQKYRSNIWWYSVGSGASTNDEIAFKHPAIFPEKLAADHIISWSNERDIIYDPFSGSGSTLKMAHIYNRNWIGSEISLEYCNIIKKRLDTYIRQTKLF